ncbi:MAG: inorganic phosphate transporter [Sideroxyarcus sp.]|nr:inorganic phosphate transporter [Sideroxyarcus sp.]
MEGSILSVGLIVAIAWLYDFYNGANDAANAIATTVSTRVLTPTQALLLAAILNGAGAFITTRVAKTIGKGIVDPELLGGLVLASALLGAVMWVAASTRIGMPVSVTHALVGGIVGAVFIPHGLGVIKFSGFKKILAGMIFSPVLGFVIAGIFLLVLYYVSQDSHPAVAQKRYGKAQILSASFMALTHGMNDTQNAMGIITVALFTGGFIQEFEVPIWVILGSGLFMGIGTYVGGWRVIRTVGMRIARLKPVHGFAAETAAGSVIAGASYLGIPISTTHAITSSVIGVGAVDRLHGVRWHVARDIVFAWIFTIPGSALSAGLIYLLLNAIF